MAVLLLRRAPGVARKIINKGLLAARARKAARAARDNIIRKALWTAPACPANWPTAPPKTAPGRAIYRRGPIGRRLGQDGRNSYYQAILPLRGKVLNVERARLDKMLANQEILNLIKALGRRD
jgi:DNA gyrase subunit B